MRNLYFAAALIGSIATPALAQSNVNGNQTGQAPIYDALDNANGNQAIRGVVHDNFDANGNANSNGNQANHGNVDDRFDDQRNVVGGDNSNTAGFGSSIEVTNSHNTTNSGNDGLNSSASNSASYNHQRSTPMAYAPTMIASCGASVSGGGSGPGFGAALGVPVGVQTCQRILLATQMAALGKAASACEVMRQDRRVARAMEAAGEGCEVPVMAYVPPVEPVAVPVAPVAVLSSPFNDVPPATLRQPRN